MDKKFRILVVDDERGSRRLIEESLSRLGYEIVQAESGEEALKIIALDCCFDLVLLDYLMVGLNGLEVLQQIKTNPATRSLKVMMITALNGLDEMEQALCLGAEDYLLKPLIPVDLVLHVKMLLGTLSI